MLFLPKELSSMKIWVSVENTSTDMNLQRLRIRTQDDILDYKHTLSAKSPSELKVVLESFLRASRLAAIPLSEDIPSIAGASLGHRSFLALQ
jgi:hypothetical protein